MNRVPRLVASVLLSVCVTYQCSLPRSYGEESAPATASPPYLMQMIRDDAIHQELGLDAATIKQVDLAIGEVDPRWWVSRILPAEKQAAEVNELSEILLGYSLESRRKSAR